MSIKSKLFQCKICKQIKKRKFQGKAEVCKVCLKKPVEVIPTSENRK